MAEQLDEQSIRLDRLSRKVKVTGRIIGHRRVLQARIDGKILTQVYTKGKKKPGQILQARIIKSIKNLPDVNVLTNMIEIGFKKKPRSFQKRFETFRISASFAAFYKGKPVGVFWGSSVTLPVQTSEASMLEEAKLAAAGRAMQKVGLIRDSDTDTIPEGMILNLITKRWIVYRNKSERSRFSY